MLNLCDGDDVNGYPGLSVVRALEAAGCHSRARARAFMKFDVQTRTKQRLSERGVRTAGGWTSAIRTRTWARRRHDRVALFIKTDVSAGSAALRNAAEPTTWTKASSRSDGVCEHARVRVVGRRADRGALSGRTRIHGEDRQRSAAPRACAHSCLSNACSWLTRQSMRGSLPATA